MERDTLDGIAHFLDYEIASASHLGSRGKFLEEISAGVHRGNPQVRTAKINSNREWGHGLDNDHRKLIFYDSILSRLLRLPDNPGALIALVLSPSVCEKLSRKSGSAQACRRSRGLLSGRPRVQVAE